MRNIFCVGLTGGIGSGKTTVSGMFRELGAGLIDADSISRELTSADGPATPAIVQTFGKQLIDDRGNLKRDDLRQLVFNDSGLRQQLESIIHPLVAVEIKRQLSGIIDPYCILSIPLLIEKKSDYNIDRVLVIDAPEELQISRTCSRDNLAATDVKMIISAQVSRHERLEAADDVITNDGSLDTLSDKVKALHQKYLQLSTSQST